MSILRSLSILELGLILGITVGVAVVVVLDLRSRFGSTGRTRFGAGPIARTIYIIGSSTAFALTYAAGPGQYPSQFDDWPGGLIVPALVGATLILSMSGLLGKFLGRHYKKRNQARRDRRALWILEQVVVGTLVDYSLYLRAFATTDTLLEEDSRFVAVSGMDPRDERDKFLDLETSLAAAVEGKFPLVGLGEPGEHIGAGRIKTTEADWKGVVEILAKKAVVLFVVPSYHAGTQWEIDWILEHDYLVKTIFMMPSKHSSVFSKFLPDRIADLLNILPDRAKSIDWEKTWDVLAPIMRGKGLELPTYHKGGLFFTIGKDGGVNSQRSTKYHRVPVRLAETVTLG